MTSVDTETVKAAVRKTYGRIASAQHSSGCCGTSGCCGSGAQTSLSALGYSEDERQTAPEGSDLGLGCGNPQAIAELQAGERVLDLGSGAGFDAFLAARQVGPSGSVIGVDMTPEMITKARGNILKTDLQNVEFRLGEIEHLPVADESVDAILSNCVINLSTGQTRGLSRSVSRPRPGRPPRDLRHRRAQRDPGRRPGRSRGLRRMCLGRRACRRSRTDASRSRIPERSRGSEDQQRRPGSRLVARRGDARGVRTHPGNEAPRSREPEVK